MIDGIKQGCVVNNIRKYIRMNKKYILKLHEFVVLGWEDWLN